MLYEWDETKATANLRRHGVDFTRAAQALEDPDKVERIDLREDYGEERIQTICWSRGLLFVVSTMRTHDLCRIISARKATGHERRLYEDR